jgi:hypothetical protein
MESQRFMTTDVICIGHTKSGAPCQGKPGPTGYCSVHNPATIAKREQERQTLEAKRQADEERCKSLQEILTVMKATCEGKGWKVSTDHFDDKTGQHVSLEVSRYFTRDGFLRDSVTGKLDVTLHAGRRLQYSLQGTSFYKYGIEDLMAAIKASIALSFPEFQLPKKASLHDEALQKLEFLLRRFHRIAHQLTLRHDNRQTLVIKDEYDVQDLLHAQLLGLFDDVRPEDPAPTHAGKASRLDFFLKREKIMVEVKMTRDDLRDAKVGEQLIIDIERYRARSDCQMLICFVYDPGHNLKNPKSLEDDLSRKHDHLTVKVIVYSP